jgi:hypothetical protein
MIDSTFVRTYGSKNFYCDQQVRGEAGIAWGNGANRFDPNSWDRLIICANSVNTGGGYFFYNQGNAYGAISDRRTKNSIENLPEEDAINFVMNLRPVTFKMNEIDKFSCGFIAQEVLGAAQNEAQKNITPKHEEYDDNNPESPLLGIADHQITPNVVSTIQYLFNELIEKQRQIQSLEVRLKALEDLLK